MSTIRINRLSNLTPSLNSKPSNEGLNTDLLLFLPSQIVAEQTLPDSASDLFIGSFQTANITLGCTVCYSCSNLSHCQINKEIRQRAAFSCIQCPNVYFFSQFSFIVAKVQSILKANFVLIWIKKRTKLFFLFLPWPQKIGQIKKSEGTFSY